MRARVGLLVLAAALVGCKESKAPQLPQEEAEPIPIAKNIPVAEMEPPKDEVIDAPPVELITGAAAERAIAKDVPGEEQEVAPEVTPLTQMEGVFEITGRSLGPLELDMPKATVAAYIGGSAYFQPMNTVGAATREMATLKRKGQPPATLYLLGGTLDQIFVNQADPRVMTYGEIGVGDTMGAARLAHGRVGVFKRRGKVRGFYFEDLLGVVFVPRNKKSLQAKRPPDDEVIAQIMIVGPAETPLLPPE